MFSIIEAEAKYIFTRPGNRGGKLHLGYVVDCPNRSKRLDLTKTSPHGFIQNSLQNQLPFFVVFDQVEHLIWPYDCKGMGSKVNVQNLAILYHPKVRPGNIGSRKADKFHSYLLYSNV